MKRIILSTVICFMSISAVFSQDTCANAIDITASLTSTCNTIAGPFAFAGDPTSLDNVCGQSSGPTDGIWFTFTAPFSGLIDVTNTNDPGTPDTQVSILSGGCGMQICEGDDDDGGSVFTSAAMGTPIVAGTQYWIEWTDGWGGAPENMEIRLIEGGAPAAPAATPGMTDALVTAGNCDIAYDIAPFTPSDATPGIATALGETITGLTPETTYTICSFCTPCGFVGNDDPESALGDPVCVDFTTLPDVVEACEISATASNIMCDPGATPEDGSDDMITFEITVLDTGGGGTTWSDDQGNSGQAYGTAVMYGPFLAGGSQSVVITDDGDPMCTQTVTVSLNDCASVENIPTVGEWGLIMLGLLMFITAVVGIRQRREEEVTA